MAYQYLIVNLKDPQQVQGSNSAVVAQSYQNIPGFLIIDATNQNVLGFNRSADFYSLNSPLTTTPIPLTNGFFSN